MIELETVLMPITRKVNMVSLEHKQKFQLKSINQVKRMIFKTFKSYKANSDHKFLKH